LYFGSDQQKVRKIAVKGTNINNKWDVPPEKLLLIQTSEPARRRYVEH
jgi:hypothetical protein